MTKRIPITVSVITTVIILACAYPAAGLPSIVGQTPTNTSIPTRTLVPTVTPTISNILWSEDFSAQSNELETSSSASGSAQTKDGAYIVRSTSDLWKWGRSKSEFGDTVIEFDVTITITPANNNAGVGVICRMRTHDDNSIDGYLLAISSDGFYSIRSIRSSSMTPLIDWTYSDTVKQGNQENKIRATCNGSELILEVNGQVLGIVTAAASGPQSGGYAFAAVSFETAELTAEARFDNLVVSKP